ncbi:unnamed protein product [Ixodes pacificus]
MGVLPLRSRPPLPVRTHQVPTDGISRGVIHGCKPKPTAKLLEALYADGVDVLTARPTGSKGTVLIHFASPHPPREVMYWSFPRRVECYEQRSLVCPRCHRPGHKATSCPINQPVCSNCGKQHEQPPEACPNGEAKYCGHCKQDGHVATDPSCPARAQFAQRAKQREGAKQERMARSRSRKRRQRSKQPSGTTNSRPGSKGTTSQLRGSSKVQIQDPLHSYADITARGLKGGRSPNARQMLETLQVEQDRDHADFDSTMKRLEQQLKEIQRTMEQVKCKHNQRQKSRAGRPRALHLEIEEEERLETELLERSKRRQSL